MKDPHKGPIPSILECLELYKTSSAAYIGDALSPLLFCIGLNPFSHQEELSSRRAATVGMSFGLDWKCGRDQMATYKYKASHRLTNGNHEEATRRVRQVLKSQLNGKNNNMYALPVIRYPAGICNRWYHKLAKGGDRSHRYQD